MWHVSSITKCGMFPPSQNVVCFLHHSPPPAPRRSCRLNKEKASQGMTASRPPSHVIAPQAITARAMAVCSIPYGMQGGVQHSICAAFHMECWQCAAFYTGGPHRLAAGKGELLPIRTSMSAVVTTDRVHLARSTAASNRRRARSDTCTALASHTSTFTQASTQRSMRFSPAADLQDQSTAGTGRACLNIAVVFLEVFEEEADNVMVEILATCGTSGH